MNRLWDYFSGKKTAIGAGFLLAAACGEKVIVGEWHYDPDWMHPLINTIEWVGMVFSTGGLAHKGGKAIATLKQTRQ